MKLLRRPSPLGVGTGLLAPNLTQVPFLAPLPTSSAHCKVRSLSKTYSECQDGNRRGSSQVQLPLNSSSAEPLSNSTSCTHEIHSNLGLSPRKAYIATAFQQTGTWWCIQLAVTLEDSPSWPFRLCCHILRLAEMLNGLLSCALLLLPSCEDYNILPS